ncbi:hypothetical protein GCK72_006701 [Caenorhabditis remanei]|uniref:Uncharacterized protein n=1 Tax=Caenorhabditis remanei TaxID=31234 RepID=A0A6A5HK26_CAERE|nr:hypothetical protein GCK72_006701 [Caenorhabditis remanei]KAF1766743.1 hypothetical protein GCK72_006701 [Caenorhabditis remanei]
MLKVRLFHDNLVYIGTPIFALWSTLISAKLIVIAYRLKFLKVDYEIGEHITLWTDNPDKMLTVNSTEGLEPLMLGGFWVWHFGFSVMFGSFVVVVERVIASMLIDNYELSTDLYIPIILNTVYQLSTISISIALVFNKLGEIVLNASWITCFTISLSMYFYIKRINKRWLQEMEDPNRKRVFTVSQRFQVRENLRALAFGKRIVFTVMGSLIFCGIGMVALSHDIVPAFLLHIGENLLFCHPLFVCVVTMYGHPSWKSRFKRSFPRIHFLRKPPNRVVSVEIMEDNVKKLSLETDIYFKQLKDSWI